MRRFSALPVLVLGLTVSMTGCIKTTRLVQKTQAPDKVQVASATELDKQISERDAAMKTLNATVQVTFSTGGSKEGKVTTYTSFKGFITVAKPHNLRVIMQLPVVGSTAGIMVSDGNTFRLTIPPYSKAYEGTNQVTKPSANTLENLRPSVFFDSLLIPGVGPDDLVELTESARIIPGEKHKPSIEEPDYDFNIMKVKSGNVLQRERVIHVSRIDLMPIQQDVYDDGGRIVTTTTYDNYKDFGGQKFPTLINIHRPLQELSLKVEISKLTFNETLDEDVFELKIPPGYKVQKLE